MIILQKIWLHLALILSLFAVGAAQAENQTIDLKVGEGLLVRIEGAIRDILLTDPTVADIQLTQGNNIFVFGKKIGQTHLLVMSEDEQVIFDQQLRIGQDYEAFEALISKRFKGTNVKVEQFPGRLMLSGQVQTPAQMENIFTLSQGMLAEGMELVNNLDLGSSQQVNLSVRVMEMNRSRTEKLGINWNILFNPGSLAVNLISEQASLISGNGSTHISSGIDGRLGSIDAVLDVLREQNLVTVLAEPNLTSRSGEKASFFAGGEFPIPVAATDDQIRIEFKQFGIILDMVPTILSDNRIRLKIRPEVSELTTVGAVRMSDIVIPGIAVRRTEATIELSSGQSFAVAGLLQSQNRRLVREVPWLSELDVLGPLFKSQEYQSAETELVVIATAHIVRPIRRGMYSAPGAPADPGRDFPSSLTSGSKGKGRTSLLFNGPRGYIY